MLTGLALATAWAKVAPWLGLARAGAGRGVAELRTRRVTLDGLAVLTIAALALGGGWWIAHQARAAEKARLEQAQAAATAALQRDLRLLVDARAGRIAETDARLAGINAELRALVAALPADLVTHERVVVQTLDVPFPVPVTGAPAVCPPPVRVPTPATCADALPDSVRAKLNEINVRRTP